ncbi:DUF3727 domain-containing protein [Phormidium yuhuli AB48]|uniref:DUF3727 domain-containing protein n=1 Tax=Phormidium yuhuli AB48 TaxID=2940671 RepID=A0ABY5AKW2_9CYAN|nr:DUF3727 domain-containing protein [Phormidium yuhuli]USR89406.1 DUF3727 domain-containing protein [Phormidium yuhuli AB48]
MSVSDEQGRSLPCYVEHQFEMNGVEYAVLLPVNIPVDLVTWSADDDSEDEEADLATEEEIDQVFETAKAVLAEQDLLLQRTALTLTVVGEIPELDEAIEALNRTESDDDEEELLCLANFYEGEQEYGLYVPIDPMLVLARINADAKPELLTDAELDELEPLLPSIESLIAEQLFNGFE